MRPVLLLAALGASARASSMVFVGDGVRGCLNAAIAGKAWWPTGLEAPSLERFNYDVAMEALYQLETVKFDAHEADLARLALLPGSASWRLFATSEAEEHFDRAYYRERLVTAVAGGIVRRETEEPRYGNLVLAELVKKPVPTRIGALLQQQHEQWLTASADRDGFPGWLGVPAVRALFELQDPAWRGSKLLLQALMIFGFLNRDDPEQCQVVLDTVMQSDLVHTHVNVPTPVLPVIDEILTLLLHDPHLTYSPAWSSLRGFSPAAHKLSELDKVAADFVFRVMDGGQYCPSMLFKGPRPSSK